MSPPQEEQRADEKPKVEEEQIVGDSKGVVLAGGGAVLVCSVHRCPAPPLSWFSDHVEYLAIPASAAPRKSWPFQPCSRRFLLTELTQPPPIFKIKRIVDDAFADRVIACAQASHGWSSTRHDRHPANDLPVALIEDEDCKAQLFAKLNEWIIPAAAQLFGTAAEKVSLKDFFIVRYTADTQFAGLEQHVDGCAYSFNVLLSPPEDFDGGGTAFESLGWGTLSPGRGECLLHRGAEMHCGKPITRGMRFIVVGFLRHSVEQSSSDDNPEAAAGDTDDHDEPQGSGGHQHRPPD
jgi:predicted 2-oxoglutarate/Fe(II)-dependent dioxygenase YbiX